MKITTPQEMGPEVVIDELIQKFEEKLSKEQKGKAGYILSIEGSYDYSILELVAKAYSLAGWKNVACSSSSGFRNDSYTTLTLKR